MLFCFSQSKELEGIITPLADKVAEGLRTFAPKPYSAMCAESAGIASCRIGSAEEKPFGACGLVCDYCSHFHKDGNDLAKGVTAVGSHSH